MNITYNNKKKELNRTIEDLELKIEMLKMSHEEEIQELRKILLEAEMKFNELESH